MQSKLGPMHAGIVDGLRFDHVITPGSDGRKEQLDLARVTRIHHSMRER